MIESVTVNYESSMNGDEEEKIDLPADGLVASTVKLYSFSKSNKKKP
jgi:hypothetical protein